MILKPSISYLEDAANRYRRRILKHLKEEKGYEADWDDLLAIAAEAGILKKKIGDPISKVWAVSGTAKLKEVFDVVGVDLEDIAFSHPEALARNVGRMAFQISESTARSIEHAITRDLGLGLSVEEIAKNIEGLGAFAPSRAMRIARTESARAVNDAANQAFRQAKAELDIDLKKQWLSSRDDKVREAHQILDGQIVDVDENFFVDGEEAQSIGDFQAAYLDVNCRCTILAVFDDD